MHDAAPHEGLAAAVAAARHVRPDLADARAVLEAELVITPGLDEALAQLGLALRALYALEAATPATGADAITRAMASLHRARVAVQGEASQHGSLVAAGERIALDAPATHHEVVNTISIHI